MRNAIFTMTLAVLCVALAGCDSSDDSTAKDAGGTTDSPGVGQDTTGEEASQRDAADAPTVEAMTTETMGEARADAGVDAAADAGIDGAKNLGVDGATDTGIDGATVSGTTLDGGSRAQVTLRKVAVYGDCMPSIALDPIIVFWTVDIAGARVATAQLTKAVATVTGKTTIVQDFIVDKPTITLVDGVGSADQRKSDKNKLSSSVCDSMCGGSTYQLDLVYEIDGQSIAVSNSGEFSCAY